MRLFLTREERDFLKKLTAYQQIGPDALTTAAGLQAEVIALKTKITDLEIQRAQKQEEWDRGDRELRHMVGLERKRQETERELATREAVAKVREENLAADKTRFAEEMKFQRERFEKEVSYLKDMMGDILARLPNINMEIRKGPQPAVDLRR